jgi:polysaccharide pyruvyl transferase WcaK-like protein
MSDLEQLVRRAPGSGEQVRVLIENSEYWLRNNGDLAMLAVTIGRLRHRWPDARIAVLTDSPALLRAYFPEAEGISVFDADPWGRLSWWERIAGRLGPRLVGPVTVGQLRCRVWLRMWLPDRVRSARGKLLRMLQPTAVGAPASAVVPPLSRAPLHEGSAAAARGASLVLSLGGGYLTDADRAQTVRVFNLLEHACNHDIPVALVGQGLGPLSEPALQERAAEVLSRAGFVSLREGRCGPKVLRRAGVLPDRFLVTGDDAIELAYAARSESMGRDLGICLRVAGYSPVSASVRSVLGEVVRTQAATHAAALVPLIIAEFRSQDRRSTLPLVRGADAVVSPLPRYVHPAQVAQRVARCRVLVTGAYHLAVFALSQGIPVVALTSSQYYSDKFLGLADMFGAGLILAGLDEPGLAPTLTRAIQECWAIAPEVREPLRERARAQIAASQQAFERVFALVETPATEPV